MMEIQIRRECRKPEPVGDSVIHSRVYCPDCGAERVRLVGIRKLEHVPVIEWRSLAEVIRELQIAGEI